MTEENTAPQKKFSEFTLASDVLDAIGKMGFQAATPIQGKVIGPILEGRDVVGKAETGTGKTIGFGAPMVGRMDTQRVAVQGLVLAPTRELAQQVAGVIKDLGAGRNLKVALIVGGVHASEQIVELRSGSQLVVGTPGRVLDFVRERILSLAWCEVVVLDEADRMLDMGFIADVTEILKNTPDDRQTLLFSATLPGEIRRLLKEYMKDPQVYSTSTGLATVDEIRQVYIEVEFPAKFRELRKIFDENSDDTAIVFCNTRRQAIDLDRMLWGHGYSAGALHGEQEQQVRFRVLESFRKGDIRILVATDVASRGLDIDDVTRVINYEVPDEAEAYVHRIGRTGRANKAGEAVTLVARKERRQWEQILRESGFSVERVGARRRASPDSREAGQGEGAKRRRRRRGRGVSARSGGRDREKKTASGDTPDKASATSDERRQGGETDAKGRRSKRGPQKDPRRRRGRPRRSRTEREETPTTRAPNGGVEKAASRPKPPVSRAPERPEKTKFEFLDDDFVKANYFDVDESVVQRARTTRESSRARSQGKGGDAEPSPPASSSTPSSSTSSSAPSRKSGTAQDEGKNQGKKSGSSRRRRRRGGKK